MGGTNEKVIPKAAAPAPPKSAGGLGVTSRVITLPGSVIRVHESDGEVHFHDDAEGIKVAVEVPTFAESYPKYIAAPDGPLIFADWQRLTLAVLQYTEKKEGEIFDATLDVRLERIGLPDGVKIEWNKTNTFEVSVGDNVCGVYDEIFVARLNEIEHRTRTDAAFVEAAFIDMVRQTRCRISRRPGVGGSFSLDVAVEKIRATGALAKLNDFVNAR